MRPLNLIGQTFGRLTVLRRDSPHADGAIWWVCTCVCGAEKSFRGADLKRGFVKSCGCLKIEAPSLRCTHGGANTRLYRIWQAIKDRTENPKASRYEYYGGCGISMCAEWRDFAVFREWALSHGYADNLSIDRYPDNNGNYEPTNCRWATQQQQVRNRRTKEQMKEIRHEAF